MTPSATGGRRSRRTPAAAASSLEGGALLASSSSGSVAGELRHLPLDAIDPDLNPNPRGDVDTTSEAFAAFLASIRASGVLQPVGAHPHPDDPERVALTMGWRRYTAATIAELDTIPVYVTALTGSALVRAIAENSAREDLSPLQEAHAIQTLMDDEGLNQVDAGKLIGRSERTVRERLRLLKLPPDVAAAIDKGEVPAYAARTLQAVGETDPQRAEDLVAQVRSGELSAGEAVKEAAPAARPANGRRAEQALVLVKEQPGITIPEIAERMGLKQSYLYRILPGLEQDGEVVKRGRGWYPAGARQETEAFDLRAALDELHTLILERMAAATNADLACDGPVGDQEGKVWAEIEDLARRQRAALTGTVAQVSESGGEGA